MPNEFSVKDCSLIAIATGRHARNLRELSHHLQEVHVGSLYHHFWGERMHSTFDEPEYQNDFAGWVRRALHDNELAERLGILDPTSFADLEALRAEMLNIIDDHLSSIQYPTWAAVEQPFSFLRSQTVIYDTYLRIAKPKKLKEAIPHFSLGTIYYHFIDARRRLPSGSDDFRVWLSTFGTKYEAMIYRIASLDPYFCSLAELKTRLTRLFDETLPD